MEEKLVTELNEINKLMIYNRSMTLLEQESVFTQNMFNPRYGIFSDPDTAEKYLSELPGDLDSLSSFLCGDDSPFADWFTIPLLDYPSEELFCDVAAGLLMFTGPIGAIAGLGIEIAHARDLYNKGDKLGAFLSLTLGLLPFFGDAAAVGLRSLIRKFGSNVFTNSLKVFTLLLKFLNGDVGVSRVYSAMKNLSLEERKLLYKIWEYGTNIIDSGIKSKEGIEKMYSSLLEYPLVDKILPIGKESLENVLDVLDGTGIGGKAIDILSQQVGIFTLILGPRVIAELGYREDDLSFETQEELFDYMLKNPDLFLGEE